MPSNSLSTCAAAHGMVTQDITRPEAGWAGALVILVGIANLVILLNMMILVNLIILLYLVNLVILVNMVFL